VNVHVDLRGNAPLPQDVSVALFRIAQEALQNVNRHSGATEAWVMLDATGPAVRLCVRDDGHGFDAAAVTPEHLGLAMMRERGEDAHVRVTVESAPGAGTTVTADWRPEERP
jgi:signal transduction histidine kinase